MRLRDAKKLHNGDQVKLKIGMRDFGRVLSTYEEKGHIMVKAVFEHSGYLEVSYLDIE